MVRRDESSFPNWLSGGGLLLLRLTMAGALFADAVSRIYDPRLITGLPALGELLLALLLSMGLCTTITAVLVSVLHLTLLFIEHGRFELRLLLMMVSLCVAILGPGPWSIDGRYLRPRRVEIKNLRDD